MTHLFKEKHESADLAGVRKAGSLDELISLGTKEYVLTWEKSNLCNNCGKTWVFPHHFGDSVRTQDS